MPRTSGDAGHSWVSSPATDDHERAAWERSVALVHALRADGDVSVAAVAAKRSLQLLPVAAQLHSESPLLDARLFRFDERSVSALEKPRAAADAPVRFFSRHTDRLSFALDTALPPGVPDAAAQAAAAMGFRPRRYSSFIFHPSLPLVISGQHSVVRAALYNVHCAVSGRPGGGASRPASA